MTDYRIEIKVRNNVILYKLEQAGYSSIGEFCRLNDVKKYVSQICAIVNMTLSPLMFDGKFRNCIHVLAESLGCAPEDLFTDVQLNTVLKSNRRSLQVGEAEMRFMLEKADNQKLLEDMVFDEAKTEAVEKAVNTLTPREQKVINLRFGLGEYSHSHTLLETGEIIGTSRERVRQIEAKALRKMRSPRCQANFELREFE